MPSQDGVKVQVLVDGQPLEEYLEPSHESEDESDVDEENENKLVRYIQASAGQKFSVRVSWEAGFTLKHAPFLYAALNLDDIPSLCHNQKCSRLRQERDKLTQPHENLFSFVKVTDDNGNWKRVYYEFGALHVDENSKEKITPNKALGIGTIQVKVYRARAVKLAVPYIPDGSLPTARDVIPEKALKGRELAANVKYNVTTERSSAYAPQNEEFYPVRGKAGTATTFVFQYRDKRALQNLGCIPRSPSPEPDYKLLLESQEELVRRQKRELVKMRMELLQASQNSAPTGTKRVREEDNEEMSIIEGPAKKPHIEIDLTEDDD